ncbi:MAG TPA: hypothetical protein VK176_12720 [Phycisphaerales bacterium]|nr:hypothetical protein [Phycisphaerales bacterium]
MAEAAPFATGFVTVFTGATLDAAGLAGAPFAGALPLAAGFADAFAVAVPVDLPVPGPLGLEVFFAKGDHPKVPKENTGHEGH